MLTLGSRHLRNTVLLLLTACSAGGGGGASDGSGASGAGTTSPGTTAGTTAGTTGTASTTAGMASTTAGTTVGTATGTTAGTEGSTAGETSTGTGEPPPPPDCGGVGPALDDLGTTPDTVAAPFPTLEHASLVWEISGDTNENGTVTVRYRELGAADWRVGTPLQRVPAGSYQGFSWSNKHAGSLFGLIPDTTYEVELFLLDPDGGCAIETLEVTTRAVPEPMQGAPVIPVTPGSIAAALAASAPGEILELGPGNYGEIIAPNDGTPSAPIVLRGSAGAVVQGDVRLDGRSYVMVDNLTIEGMIKFNGGVGITVRRSQITTAEHGIITFARAENAYIADNVVVGATLWNEAALGVNGNNIGEGIAVTGPGHVIEHNRVRGFRDAISLMEDSDAEDQFSIDILRNDISEAADDGIEADFCFHNCRSLENRITNSFMGVSSQPSLGGPNYFVRNAMYNLILSAFKLQRSSVGDVLWNNTVIKNGDAFGVYTGDIFSRTVSRNNLMLGGPGGDYNGWSSGTGRVISLVSVADEDLDYDGFGSQTGAFIGRIRDIQFESLAELQAMTTEVNAVEVGYDVFQANVAFPADPMTQFAAPDLRIAPGSPAIDAGTPIPGITDGFTGDAPDLGAYEVGQELPDYGPRP